MNWAIRYFQVLNASHFGVSQSRERVYIVGFHHLITKEDFTLPIGKNNPICVNDILEINSNIAPIQRDDVVVKHGHQNHAHQASIDQYGNQLLPNKPMQIGIVGKGGQGERSYHADGHAITLSAHGGGALGQKQGHTT